MIDDIELLKIIEKDPRIAPADIAVQLAASEAEVEAEIARLNLDYKIEIIPYKNGELCKETSLEAVADYHAAIIANAGSADMEYLRELDPLIPIVLYNRKTEKLDIFVWVII